MIDAKFNSDLYVVGATVAPVYLVALMFPGGILVRYSKWAAARSRDDSARAKLNDRQSRKFFRRAKQDFEQFEAVQRRYFADKQDDPAVQGLREAADTLQRLVDDVRDRTPRRTISSWSPMVSDLVRVIPIWFGFIYSGLGAICSGLALAGQHATKFEEGTVTGSLILLPGIAVLAALFVMIHEVRADALVQIAEATMTERDEPHE